MKNSLMTGVAAVTFAVLIGLPAFAQEGNPPTNGKGAMAPPAGSTVQPGTTGGSGTGTGIIAGDTSGAVSDTIGGGTAAGTYAQRNYGTDHRGSSGWFGLLGLLGL